MVNLATVKRLCIVFGLSFFIFGFGGKPKENHPQPTIDTREISSEIDAAFGIAQRIDSFQKKQVFLLEIVKEYSMIQDYDKAYRVADALKRNGKITPQYVRAMSEIAISYASKNEMSQAIAVIENLETLKDKDFAYEALILYLIHENLIGNSLILIDSTQNIIIKSRLQSKIVAFYVENKQFKEAFDMISKIESISEKDQSLSLYVQGLSKTSNSLDASKVLAEIVNQQIRERSTSQLVNGLAKQQHFDKALELVNTIENSHIYQNTMVSLVSTYASLQKFETAYQLSESLKGLYKDKSISAIAIELARFGQLDNALNLTRIINDSMQKDMTLQEICVISGEAGSFDFSITVLDQLRNTPHYEETALLMGESFGKHKEYLYPNLLLKQIQPDHLRMQVFSEFVKSYAKLRSPNQTITILNEIHDELLYTSTVADIVTEFTAPEHFEKAIELAQSIPISSKRAETLLDIAYDVMQTRNDKPHALTALNDAAGDIKSIKDPFVRNQVRIMVAQAYLDLNETKIGKSLVDKSIKYLDSLDASFTKDEVISSLVPILIQAQQDRLAISIIGEMSNPYSQIYLLLELNNFGLNRKDKYDRLFKNIVATSPITQV